MPTGKLLNWTANGNGIEGVLTMATNPSLGALAAGGAFTTVNGTSRGRVAAVNIASGASFGTLNTAFSANANQLVKGNQVNVGGVSVGEVSKIVLTDDGRARIELAIKDGDLDPLPRDTHATVRSTSQ